MERKKYIGAPTRKLVKKYTFRRKINTLFGAKLLHKHYYYKSMIEKLACYRHNLATYCFQKAPYDLAREPNDLAQAINESSRAAIFARFVNEPS